MGGLMGRRHQARRTPGWLVHTVAAAEDAAVLERARPLVARLAGPLTRRAGLRDVLAGLPIGHALHPLLTDLPLGAWLSASILDLTGGEAARPAAAKLVGFGLAAAVPTVASGLVEWAGTDRRSQRAGVAHAAVNAAAASCYAVSLAARLAGHHRAGAGFALAGGTAACAGGYLGGHLTLARKAGTADPRLARGIAARSRLRPRLAAPGRRRLRWA
jgi:uncharacterized membrane protein